MKTICIFFSVLFLSSCTNQKETFYTTCNTNNPLEDLIWLKEIKNGFEMNASATKKQITQYTYKNETVFMIDFCVNCTDNLITVYNCSGAVICEFGGIVGVNTCPDFDENRTHKIILWEN